MNPVIIEVKNVGYKAGYHYLLKNINWQVKKGEHWVVFGMNGSGKTTLLTLISGFHQQTHGTIKVFDNAFTNENILAMRKRIGLISGSFFDKCYSKETALEIVLSGKFGALGLEADISNNDIRRARQLLKEFRMKEKIDYPYDLMSKGERQNVLLARALMSKPDILILDEPSTGLDILAREHLLTTVRDLAEKTNMTLIYVTHYTEEILDVFEHCLLMKDAQVFRQGKTEQLLQSEVMSQFLDYPVEMSQSDSGIYLAKVSTRSNIKDMV